MTPLTIHALLDELRRGQGRAFSKLEILLQLTLDPRVNFGFGLGVPQFARGQVLFVAVEGVARLPVFKHRLGHILSGVVLSVALHAHGLGFDENGALARTASLDSFFRDLVNRYDVIAVNDVAGDAVSLGAVGQVLGRHLAPYRRRVGPLVVLDDADQGSLLHRRQVDALMKRSGGGAAVADPRHRDNLLAQVAAGHGDAGHYGDQVAQHGDGRDHVPYLQVAEVAGAVFAQGWRGVLGHVLGQDVARLEALHQERADIADHRRQPVPRLECVRGAHGDSLLPEAGVESPDNFVLPEQSHHLLLERAVQLHVVVELEVLFTPERNLHSQKPLPLCRGSRPVRTQQPVAARQRAAGLPVLPASPAASAGRKPQQIALPSAAQPP